MTAGLMKLFLHEILPDSVTHSIFIDTDAFFMTDPARLWQTFSDPIAFPPGTGVAIPHHLDLFAPEWHDANRVCSCVLLLDLEVLRGGHGRPALMDSVHYRDAGLEAWGPPAFAKMFGKPAEGHAYEGVKLGDQGYWWALVNGTEGLMTPLDLAWETTSCLVDMYGNDIIVGNDGIDEAEALKQSHYTGHGGVFGSGPAVYPKLLHLFVQLSTPSTLQLTWMVFSVIVSMVHQYTGNGQVGRTRAWSNGRSFPNAGYLLFSITSDTNGYGSTRVALGAKRSNLMEVGPESLLLR